MYRVDALLPQNNASLSASQPCPVITTRPSVTFLALSLAPTILHSHHNIHNPQSTTPSPRNSFFQNPLTPARTHPTMSQLPGGFLPPPLPSPSPSTVSSPRPTTLPHPRPHPLRPGSSKEETTRRWVENALLQVSRRYVKKFQPEEMRDEGGEIGRAHV